MAENSTDTPQTVWAVIPVYNNGGTIRDVVERTARQPIDGILVVDDGSEDIDVTLSLADISGITVLKHAGNLGKGRALLTALNYLKERHVDYMITLDGDGQHYPEDISIFLPILSEDNHSIVIGARDFSDPHIPEGSRFGRKFSNFWVRLETGQKVDDAQSGFRAYPVDYISQLRFLCSHYNFEIEVLVRAAWAGLTLKNAPIRVWYPHDPKDRVSSFRPILDNFRIALINTHLVGLRMLPIPRKKLVGSQSAAQTAIDLLRHPLKAIKELLRENATPGGLAAAAGVGAFLAVLPLPGFHTVAILYASARLHLNKIMAVNIQHFFMPPFVPFICLETGYYLRHGKFLTTLTFDTVVKELAARIIEWWIGAIVLSLPLAILTAGIVYIVAKILKTVKSYSIKQLRSS